MSSKKEIKILDKDTVLSIKLSKKHPNDRMFINGVEIAGYQFKNYELPKGTDIASPEVKAWFIIEKAHAVKAPAHKD